MRSHWLESGATIVQGLFISTVLAGSALIATRMITTQKMAVKSAETKDHIMQLHKLIYSELQNREHCLMTFAPVIGSGLLPGTPQTFNVPSIMAKVENSVVGAQRYTTNSGAVYDPATIYMNGNVRIDSMTLNTSATIGDPQALVINYRRLEGKKNDSRTKVGFGGSSISKTIWIRIQRSPSALTAVDGCYAVERGSEGLEEISQPICTSMGAPYFWDATAGRCKMTGQGNEDLNKEFCENLGTGGSLYTWDDTRNACILKNNICGTKQVFEGISSTGLAICRSINDYLPYLIQPGANPCTGSKTSVSIVKDPVTGKVSIECPVSGGGTCNYDWELWEFVGCGGNGNLINSGSDSQSVGDSASCDSICNPGCFPASKMIKTNCVYTP